MQSSSPRIEISVEEQRLRLFDGEDVVAEYPVSTARRGLGSEEGSYKTPTGRFEIGEKIGDGAAPGTIFVSRKPSGSWKEGDSASGDMVLSRILWLEGSEPQNANTRERYIYIHGTNQEDRIGEPASEGCIRMRNADIVDLYDRVSTRTPVTIA